LVRTTTHHRHNHVPLLFRPILRNNLFCVLAHRGWGFFLLKSKGTLSQYHPSFCSSQVSTSFYLSLTLSGSWLPSVTPTSEFVFGSFFFPRVPSPGVVANFFCLYCAFSFHWPSPLVIPLTPHEPIPHCHWWTFIYLILL